VYNKKDLALNFCKRFLNLDGDINNIQSNSHSIEDDLLGKLSRYFNKEYTNSGTSIESFITFLIIGVFHYPIEQSELNNSIFIPGIDPWYKPKTDDKYVKNIWIYLMVRLILNQRVIDLEDIVDKYKPEYMQDLQESQIFLTKLLSQCMDEVTEEYKFDFEDVQRLNLIEFNN